jgi:xanthine permease XanP
MKKPANIVYGVNDKPPLPLLILSALQHFAIMAVYLIFPLIVCREAGTSIDVTVAVLSISMLAIGVATLLQSSRMRIIGSGYLCPEPFSAAYLSPSITAVGIGGLPLVFCMTAFAGLVEAGFSRILHRLRPFFPPEIAGLVVLLVGFTNAVVGVGYLVGPEQSGDRWRDALLVAAVTLISMMALNVWTRGTTRMICALIGIIVGYAVSAQRGLLTATDSTLVENVPVLALPSIAHLGWSFHFVLVIPFLIAALAATLKSMAVLSICQRINDDEWIRPDLENLRKGVAADGLGTFIAGALGTLGVNVSPSSVGLSAAAGVTSRTVAYAIAAVFVVAAFLPGVAVTLAVMPKPVMAAALMFTSCFLLINGMQTITSRMLDSRKTFVVGLTIVGGLAVETVPHLSQGAPIMIKPIFDSALVFGTLLAFMLNIVFRIGIRQKVGLLFDVASGKASELDDFLEGNGAKWGARRDIIDRGKFALHQGVEAIADHCAVRAPLRIEASFDEFNLELAVSYEGAPLELPEERPSDAEIRDTEDGLGRLAGFLLRSNADQAWSERVGKTAIMRFHFDH